MPPEQEQFRIEFVMDIRACCGRLERFFQQRVSIDAAKSKGVDARAARRVRIAMNPRPRL